MVLFVGPTVWVGGMLNKLPGKKFPSSVPPSTFSLSSVYKTGEHSDAGKSILID